MRAAVVCLLVVAGASLAQEKIAPRYGIEADTDRYAQKSAKDTLRSVLQAIEAKKIDYLLAHLAEPSFVDERVKQTGGKFEVMVQETTAKLNADPESIRTLRDLLSSGEWKEEAETASVAKAGMNGKSAHFRKIGTRWYFENRQKPENKQP